MLSLSQIKNLNKGSGVLNLNLVRKEMIDKYMQIGYQRVTYEIFYIKSKDYYIFTFKIPSQSNYKYARELFYDVVFEFRPINGQMSAQTSTLNDYGLYVYSNCPSFIFSYNFIYYTKNHLIKWMPRRYFLPEALKTSPDTRNAYGIINYEYSIYFAYLTIIMDNLFQKEVLQTKYSEIKNSMNTLQKVLTQDQMMKMRKEYDKLYKIKDEKKRKSNKEKYNRDFKKNAVLVKVHKVLDGIA